jgi:hypothetical protein
MLFIYPVLAMTVMKMTLTARVIPDWPCGVFLDEIFGRDRVEIPLSDSKEDQGAAGEAVSAGRGGALYRGTRQLQTRAQRRCAGSEIHLAGITPPLRGDRAFWIHMLTRTTFVIARRKVAVAIQYVFLDCFAFGLQ